MKLSPYLDLSPGQLGAFETLDVQPIAVADVRQTVAALARHAACHMPADALRALRWGHDREQSPLGRSIFRQLLRNAAAASAAGRPTCQDTGQAVVVLEIGQEVRFVGGSLEKAVTEGVIDGYKLWRKSIVRDALLDRANSGNNAPAVMHVRFIPGREVRVHLMEKGYGSENKSFMTMYPYPQGGEEAVVDFVKQGVSKAGADWCPPGVLSVAVGGNFESAPLMAKMALLGPLDMEQLLRKEEESPHALSSNEKLRIRLFREVNGLGIGPQGLGGVCALLDVKVTTAPTHIAGLPIAVNVQCNKLHHASAVLDGSGPVLSFPIVEVGPFLEGLPDDPGVARRIQVPMDRETMHSLHAGERVLLTGRILTGRDAAHHRMMEVLDRGEPLPVDLRGQLLYYVGPVDPAPGEVVGSAGPTTARRMDPFHPRLLRETGLFGAIGKSERGPEVVEAIKDTATVYMIAIGGAGYLQSRTVKHVEVLAWPDLGTEAIRAFDVEDFPAIVAVDSHGTNLHESSRRTYCSDLCEGRCCS
jgi:fumarate hydratase, class I